MNCKNFLVSIVVVTLLGITSSVSADDESAVEAPTAGESKADDQSSTEEVAAKSGKVYATHVATNADELAKKLANPIAALISVPFQYNYSRTYNDDGHKNLLNIQPVVPISISKDWNLISRTILPIIQQKNVQPNRTQFGLGDTTQSLWFSPKEPTSSGLIWGVGPAALIPTGTDGIGANTWAFGPTAIVLKQTGSWTYGMLVNQLWDTGGPADISSLFIQPFLAKGLGKGRTLSINTESTYNWKTKDWTIPINIAVSKVSKWGNQMVSNQIDLGWYAKSPTGGPDWQLRYMLILMFPK